MRNFLYSPSVEGILQSFKNTRRIFLFLISRRNPLFFTIGLVTSPEIVPICFFESPYKHAPGHPPNNSMKVTEIYPRSLEVTNRP